MLDLVYVYDAICSWCYGFEPVMQSVQANYAAQLTLQMVSGGRYIGENMKPVQSVLGTDYRSQYHNVSETTGAVFTNKYLTRLIQEDNYVVNSEKPATALSVFKSYEAAPNKHLDFVYGLQKKMYQEGFDPNENGMYETVAASFGINTTDFIQKMGDDQFKYEAQQDFHLAQALQATAFPKVYIKQSDKNYYLVADGYTSLNTITKSINSVLTSLGVTLPTETK